MEEQNLHDKILKVIKEKSSVKQDVFKETIEAFRLLKNTAKTAAEKLKKEASSIDKRVIIEFNDRSEFMFELKVAGDLLVFQMHSNVFEFDTSHFIRKSPYVAKDPMLSYCGIISVFNFLADSFKYSRTNDVGYLMARLFINKESHYFVESKNRKISVMHNDFASDVLNCKNALNLIELITLACLEFDLYTPPFETQREITVSEINESSNNIKGQTGKRLGFKFLKEDSSDVL